MPEVNKEVLYGFAGAVGLGVAATGIYLLGKKLLGSRSNEVVSYIMYVHNEKHV